MDPSIHNKLYYIESSSWTNFNSLYTGQTVYYANGTARQGKWVRIDNKNIPLVKKVNCTKIDPDDYMVIKYLAPPGSPSPNNKPKYAASTSYTPGGIKDSDIQKISVLGHK